jgi:hypothetical protein
MLNGKIIEERLQLHLSSWKGKLLSIGGRLVLLNSVFSNMALYMLSFFLLPKGVLSRLDFFRLRFFWQGDSEKKKYRLAKWSVVCRPKDQGGLGIQDLEVKNTALLGKWLFRLLTEDGKHSLDENMWAQKLYHRFFGNLAIHTFGPVSLQRRSFFRPWKVFD